MSLFLDIFGFGCGQCRCGVYTDSGLNYCRSCGPENRHIHEYKESDGKKRIKYMKCEHDLYYMGVTALDDKGKCQKCGATNKKLFREIKKCQNKFCTDLTHFTYVSQNPGD